MHEPIWCLDHPVAHLHLPGLQAAVNSLTPQRGVEQLCFDATPQPGSMQGVVLPADPMGTAAQLSDIYIRGTDLIAVYTQTQGESYRAQVYWRAVSAANGSIAPAVVDVMVSLETDLPESRPVVAIETALPARDVWALDGRPVEPAAKLSLAPPCHRGETQPLGFLVRLADSDRALAILVRPEDAVEMSAQRDARGWVRITQRLLRDPLEKGVILRARARGVWGHGDVDLQTASAWYDTLLGEKLPLAT